MRLSRRSLALRIGAAVLVTIAVTLLVLNYFGGGEKMITQPIAHAYGVDDPQFARGVDVLLGPALVPGNRVDTLLNGDQIFPAMLAAIRSARRTITFETYIYWSGKVGAEFAGALAERARAGVKVHVLLDWLGSQKADPGQLALMKSAGVEIEKFHPLRWYDLDRLNNRTHRKLLVVDGRVGFTGGVGIADEWSGHAQDPDHWRDTHFRMQGPAVAQMQAAFADNWTKVTGRVLEGDAYFPAIARAGDEYAQVFRSSPEGGADSMRLMYMLSIAAATRSIDLAMAYFVPDEVTMRQLEEAMKRGVHVRLILPGRHTDAESVRSASRALWGRVLRAGGEVYEYEPTLYHCKVMVVDGLWASVGSTNFDGRSFRLNDEANLDVLDRAFAARQEADFAADLARSHRVTYEEWANRPWHEKAFEKIISIFHLQL